MPQVLILMGSESDRPVMKKAEIVLSDNGVTFETRVISAHRNPIQLANMLESLDISVQVIIAGAGLAAALPGVVASMVKIPVIGVPLESGPLKGMDALLSIVQMPSGVPVATVGINNSKNAAYLAIRILG